MYRLGATVADPIFKTSPCATVNASSIPDAVRKKFVLIRAADEARHPGYNKSCDCYYWGYRPEVINVIGLRGLGSVTENNWRVCLDPQTKCPVPPPPVKCPTCAKPPPCPTCPAPVVCPTCPQTADSGSGKYGITLGLLAAAGVLGGAGWFAWKKLKKKR